MSIYIWKRPGDLSQSQHGFAAGIVTIHDKIPVTQNEKKAAW